MWLAIVIIGVVTLAMRASFIIGRDHLRLPALAERGLSFVPVAVLSAIIVPELMIKDGEFRMPWFMLVDGELQFVLGNVRFAAGVVAIIVAWRTRNAILTIAAGMLTLWVLQWLVG